MPRPAQRCYLVAEGSGWAAFVPVPGGHGYFKTDWCVVVTTCVYCNATPGKPCVHPRTGNPTAATHSVRRDAARAMKSDPKVRARLLRAMPAVVFALGALTAAFPPDSDS